MTTNRSITVFGAYGHTGRFVVAELCRRGWTPVLAGRDTAKLDALGDGYPTLARRTAAIDDPASLDRAVAGVAAVINCAGPFLDTAPALIEAALRSRVAYLDVTAEQQSVLATFENYAQAANEAGIAVLPGMAFYGGLADLLATTAIGGESEAEAIDVAVALDSWHPTAGTRLTGRRNHYPRRVITNGRLDFLADPPPTRDWNFRAPFGTQAMVALPFSETITISRHLRVRELHSYINRAALEEIRDPATPAPTAVDAQGRSAQRFAMDVIVRNGTQSRRARAAGLDIYAFTAPLVVEAMERVVTGRCRRFGVVAPGEAFDAADFLAALSPEYLQLG
jgi:NAD(P)-dependent dehydrogenase (short-subunit alcohol dehydrogenase family)